MSRIEKLRKKRGYTQAKMQMLTGIDQDTYSKIECGQSEMTVEQCIQIADALDTSTDYLLGLTDQIICHPRCRQSHPPRRDRTTQLVKDSHKRRPPKAGARRSRQFIAQ